jgi:hypothetical protein
MNSDNNEKIKFRDKAHLLQKIITSARGYNLIDDNLIDINLSDVQPKRH